MEIVTYFARLEAVCQVLRFIYHRISQSAAVRFKSVRLSLLLTTYVWVCTCVCTYRRCFTNWYPLFFYFHREAESSRNENGPQVKRSRFISGKNVSLQPKGRHELTTNFGILERYWTKYQKIRIPWIADSDYGIKFLSWFRFKPKSFEQNIKIGVFRELIPNIAWEF